MLKKLDDAQIERKKFQQVVHNRNQLKMRMEVEALKIDAKTSEAALKRFVLMYHYHQIALTKVIEQERVKLKTDSTTVTTALVMDVVLEQVKSLSKLQPKA